ncbi:hypothetical protein AVEN_109888-1, partial [Araneus ventricosus]
FDGLIASHDSANYLSSSHPHGFEEPQPDNAED